MHPSKFNLPLLMPLLSLAVLQWTTKKTWAQAGAGRGQLGGGMC